VLLMRLRDLPRQCTSEPGLHSVCSAYTPAACPMISGQRSHYRTTPLHLEPGLAPAKDRAARLGAEAEAWFVVWLRHSRPITDPINGQPAASYAGIGPLRICPLIWRQLLT
jgi:hypothetical protein